MIIGAGLGYLGGSSGSVHTTELSTTTTTSTSTKTTTLTSTSTVTATSAYYPDLGSLLKLQVSLNATRIVSGGAVQVMISLFNPLPVNLTAIPSSNSSMLQNWGGFDFICGNNVLQSVGFALFRGHYISGNISSAGNPLTLRPPIRPPCAIFNPPSLYIVLPNSSNAVAYYLIPTQPPSYERIGPVQLKENATTGYCSVTSVSSTICGTIRNSLFGYWNTTGLQGNLDNATTSSKYFHYFSPGPYTLVAEDAWGHSIYEYFEVVP
jgi:hypothetical protein